MQPGAGVARANGAPAERDPARAPCAGLARRVVRVVGECGASHEGSALSPPEVPGGMRRAPTRALSDRPNEYYK